MSKETMPFQMVLQMKQREWKILICKALRKEKATNQHTQLFLTTRCPSPWSAGRVGLFLLKEGS